jgi:Uma2 family endonuclease
MPSTATLDPTVTEVLPDHLQLPDKDGKIVENFQEEPQNKILDGCLMPRLEELYPDGQFIIGRDSGIYWRYTQPPLDGCKAPDWFLVPGVPPMLEGTFRRSYVLWNEVVKPLLVIEYVSGDGSEERDTTPYKGKFWVYEQAICAPFYAIFDSPRKLLEVYRLDAGRYQLVQANAAGRFLIDPLRIELGIWEGKYEGMELAWLRVWDAHTGKLLPLLEERTKEAERRAEESEGLLDDARHLLNQETKRADSAEERSRKLAEKLRAAGIDPDA